MDLNNISIDKAMAFANSPAGQQLMKLIQQKNDPKIAKAMDAAAAGDASLAREQLSSLLTDPKIQEILKQFGG